MKTLGRLIEAIGEAIALFGKRVRLHIWNIIEYRIYREEVNYEKNILQ